MAPLYGKSVLYLTTYRPRVVNVAKERPLYLNKLIWLFFHFFLGLMMVKRRKKANWEKKILVFQQISNTLVMWAGIPTRVPIYIFYFFYFFFSKLQNTKHFYFFRFRFRKCGSKIKTVFLQSWSFRTWIARQRYQRFYLRLYWQTWRNRGCTFGGIYNFYLYFWKSSIKYVLLKIFRLTVRLRQIRLLQRPQPQRRQQQPLRHLQRARPPQHRPHRPGKAL